MLLRKLLFVGVFIFVGIPQVFSCSCGSKGIPSEAVKNADSVFVGSVIKFEVQGDPEVVDVDGRQVLAFRGGRKATFRVTKVWKGSHQKMVSVFTGEGGGDCGVNFVAGHEYLVYAYENDGQLETGICTRTRDVWFSDWLDAKEDFYFLERFIRTMDK